MLVGKYEHVHPTLVSGADAGFFLSGGGLTQLTGKNSDNVFLGISFLQFYRGGPLVYFKENYIFLRF